MLADQLDADGGQARLSALDAHHPCRGRCALPPAV